MPKHLERDEWDLEEVAYNLNETKENKEIKDYLIYQFEQQLRGEVTENGC